MTGSDNARGVSLIAAIFIIVVLAFMGVMFVSLIGTGSLSAVNDLRSAKALSIAEGGLQYALKTGATCSYNYPGISLGEGSFTTASQLSTAVTDTISAASPSVPLQAVPPASFVIPGVVMIDSEYLFCTSVVGNSITGCIRGWAAPPGAAAHAAGAAVIQCVITSTGIVGNASRTVQATVGP
jgi:hypothetical protein